MDKSILRFIFILILIFTIILGLTRQKETRPARPEYVLVVHGGAGGMTPNIHDSIKQAYLSSLAEALIIGRAILANGGSSIDAVEKVLNYFEDNPMYNAGRGAVLTSEGKAELDASIMFGKDLSNGAVANVKHIKNPISLARLVMEKTKHVLFAGDGAEKLAQSFGINLVDENYFIVPDELKNWLNKKESLEKNKGGTVGCVALDKYGNLAAATSTGGRFFKPPGRVGDSPLVNAGTYANNKTCAVSCTGTGEEFIRNTVAYKISALIEFKNYSLQRAADQLIFKVLKPGDGGLIAIDKNGNYVMPFSTKAMLRGVVTSNGVFETKIWK